MKTELFRNVIQIGMVVEDLDKTLQTFESLLGIGPFRITDYPPAGEPDCQREYRGANADFTARFSFFHFGNIELAIIQPLKGESIWRDFLQTHGPGIHHLKFSVDHLSPADEYLRGQGFACVQQGAAVGPNKGKTWAYYDLEGTLPLCIELMNEVIEQ